VSRTFSPDKAIDRSPISAAEFLERLLCRWRLALRLQHHAPVGSRKRDRPIVPAPVDPSQRRYLIIRRHAAIETRMRTNIKLALSVMEREPLARRGGRDACAILPI